MGFAYSAANVLEVIQLDRLLSHGYSVILETNYYSLPLRISSGRSADHLPSAQSGRSKMGTREILRYCAFLWAVPECRPPAPNHCSHPARQGCRLKALLADRLGRMTGHQKYTRRPEIVARQTSRHITFKDSIMSVSEIRQGRFGHFVLAPALL